MTDLPLNGNPVHSATASYWHWTTTNIGEGMPGVQTPLSWSIWYPAADRGLRAGAYAMGVLGRAERDSAEPRFLSIFYGRGALLVELLALIGDRIPGATGQDAVRSLYGRVPEDLVFHPTRRRYPFVALRFPWNFFRGPRLLRTFARSQDAWWREIIALAPTMDRAEAAALLVESRQRFEDSTIVQAIVGLNGVQPVYDALTRVVKRFEAGDLSKLSSPSGGAEMAVVEDIWKASRNHITVADVITKHGFHGPLEGDVAATVWREDAEPLRRMVTRYADRPDHESPTDRELVRCGERRSVERTLVAGCPISWRPLVRLLLLFTRKRLPLRGVAKRSMLQGIDGARAATRRLGELLEGDGTLEKADDAFFFTVDELAAGPPNDARTIVECRRRRHAEYLTLTLPGNWAGQPLPQPVTTPCTRGAEPEERPPTMLTGIGVSGGQVVGTACVVTNPDFFDVEPDEILIASTTDPSWSSIMFLSKALVVDLGGALSHAAVVARELDIPCVVNTLTGTTVLKTGDQIRVDGDRGTVEILQHAVVSDTVPPDAMIATVADTLK
jgi:phosphohistidine swiveling domain-containing protein